MKKYFATTVVGILFSMAINASALNYPYAGTTRPARNIKIGEKPVIRMTAANCEVVVDSKAASTTRFAAEELRKFISERFGAKIPLVNKPTPGRASLIVGINRFSKKAGIDDSKLCRDAFIIRTSANKVYILGKDSKTNKITYKSITKSSSVWAHLNERGTLFGVYDFLERFADVRFYFPLKGTLVPKAKTLDLPDINIYDRPDFEARANTSYRQPWIDGKVNSYVFNMHMMRALRRGTFSVPVNHALNLLGYVKRFGKKHPEYFALSIKGRREMPPYSSGYLCYSSGIREEIFQDAKACLTNQPAASRNIPKGWNPSSFKPGFVFGMTPNDGFRSCHCEKCKKKIGKYTPENISKDSWDLICDTAERLKKEKIDGFVSMLSYYPNNMIPARKIPDNVIVGIAARGPWTVDKPKYYNTDLERIKGFNQKLGRKVTLWNYVLKFGMTKIPGIPIYTPRAIGKYYREVSPYIYGAFVETSSDSFVQCAMNDYIMGKVWWNNQADVEAILKEYYARMFGPGAAPMQKFFERVEDIWLKQIYSNLYFNAKGPQVLVPSRQDIWTKIFSPAERRKLSGYFDEAEKAAAKKKEYLERIRFMRRYFLGPLLAAGKDFDNSTAAVPHFKHNVTTLKKDKIVINGVPDEAAWRKTVPVYLQTGTAAKFDESKIWISADKDNLYVAFKFLEPEMSKIISTRRENDTNVWEENDVEIFLNPSGDRKSYYQIALNTEGSKFDAEITREGTRKIFNRKWESGAEYKLVKNTDSWSGEIRIPLKNVGISELKPFPANFCRGQVRQGMPAQHYRWGPFAKSFHDIENFGTLTFDEKLPKQIVADPDFMGKELKKPNRIYFGKWQTFLPRQKDNVTEYDYTTFVTGNRSIKMTVSGSVERYYDPFGQKLPELKPNTKYRISYFVKYTKLFPLPGHRGGLALNFVDRRNHFLPSSRLFGNSPWTYQSFEVKTGKQEIKKASISAIMIACKGTAWFDNIMVEEMD